MFVVYKKRGESEKGVGCLSCTEKEGRGCRMFVVYRKRGERVSDLRCVQKKKGEGAERGSKGIEHGCIKSPTPWTS